MPDTLTIIELEKAFLEKLSSNIILVTTKANTIIEASDMQEMKNINLKLSKGAKYGVISESGKYSFVSEGARKHMATDEMEKNRIATAFIISSLSQRLIVKFFMKINKPSVPTKTFSTLKNAKKWMEKMVNQ